ncbi:MAG: HAMP domain-containing sensor histidine kinase [Anaerolineae bacterium]
MPDAFHDVNTLVLLLRKMSHDMRAPLGSAATTTEMLASGVYGPLDPKQVRANERVQRSVLRSIAILEDFMIYLKATTGQLDTTAKPFAPRAVLAQWCDAIKAHCDEKNLTINVVTQDKLPENLVTDSAIIGKIVLPLLWNAAAFTTEGGVWIESNWSESPRRWTISVRDSGIGIKPEETPHIYEPFWRGEERPQVPTACAGLGLASAQALAKLLKGDLTLEQSSPKGSTFRVDIPVELPEVAAPSP